MDAFFSFDNKYTVHSPIEHVRSEIKSLIDKPWYDFSGKISGKLNDDDSFKLRPKLSIGFQGILGSQGIWFAQSPTYITGSLKEENGNTIIEIISRPNFSFIILFYLIAMTVISEALGISKFTQASLSEIFFEFIPICIVVVLLMIFAVKRLRNRFERLLNLIRE